MIAILIGDNCRAQTEVEHNPRIADDIPPGIHITVDSMWRVLLMSFGGKLTANCHRHQEMDAMPQWWRDAWSAERDDGRLLQVVFGGPLHNIYEPPLPAPSIERYDGALCVKMDIRPIEAAYHTVLLPHAAVEMVR